jgi:hypothetical protein
MSLNYKLFKKLKRGQLYSESTKTYGIQNRTTVAKWSVKNSVTLIGKTKTPYYVKVARTKIMELEAKVNSRETEVLLERQPLLQIKKQSWI